MAAEGGIIALLQRGLRRDEQLIGLRAAGERVVFLLRTLKRLLERFAAFSASLKRVSASESLVCCLGGRGVGLVELGLQLCGLGAGGVQILLQQRDVLLARPCWPPPSRPSCQ